MARPTDVEVVKLLRRASANAEHLMAGADAEGMRFWQKTAQEYRKAADDLAADTRSEAAKWEAVARNIATSHPEGAAVFKRVAAAHGFQV